MTYQRTPEIRDERDQVGLLAQQVARLLVKVLLRFRGEAGKDAAHSPVLGDRLSDTAVGGAGRAGEKATVSGTGRVFRALSHTE